MRLKDWKTEAVEYRDVDRAAQAKAEAELAEKIDARRKIGRCANGAERDKGRIYHAIKGGRWVALCGAQPGRQSAGWQSEPEPVDRVNCPRCLKKLSAQC